MSRQRIIQWWQATKGSDPLPAEADGALAILRKMGKDDDAMSDAEITSSLDAYAVLEMQELDVTLNHALTMGIVSPERRQHVEAVLSAIRNKLSQRQSELKT